MTVTASPSTASLADSSATPAKRNRRRSDADKANDRMTRTPLHKRIIGMLLRAGHTPEAWQVESLAATFVANRVTPTDRELVAELMRAPWFPKPRRRHYRVGEHGWRTTS